MQVQFPSGAVDYLYDEPVQTLLGRFKGRHVILVTDSNVRALYARLFENYPTLTVNPGEDSKQWATIESLAGQLVALEATRGALLVGIGGGVVSDITGFLASVYMRGVEFGFVPTTLLGMTDAAIGGKNGVNLGDHKNLLGTIKQPLFICIDPVFLQTLPQEEWSNGFAEITKYACIFDAPLFDELNSHNLEWYGNNADATKALLRRCIAWKNKTVQEDEHEKGIRKLLNFGHTAGHAIEKKYNIPHGQAVALGMIVAMRISVEVCGLDAALVDELKSMLMAYGLPVSMDIDVMAVMNILKMDKKRRRDTIDYIVLEQKGKAAIKELAFDTIEQGLRQL